MIGLMKVRTIIIIDVIDIYEISYDEMIKLIDKWSTDKKVDHFLFFTKKDDSYICVDNEAGAFIIDTLNSRDKAICWLLRNDYSSNEINRLQEIEVRKLLRKQKYEVINRRSK